MRELCPAAAAREAVGVESLSGDGRVGVLVHIPIGLVKFTGDLRVIEVDAVTVRGAVAAVDALFPGFLDKIYTPDGRKRTIYRIFVDERDVFGPGMQGSETPVSPGTDMRILYSPLSG